MMLRGYHINTEDKLRRSIIMQMICNLYLDTSTEGPLGNIDFWQHFAAQRQQLQAMQHDGLLEIEKGGLRITERGRPFLRNICMLFDQYLPTPGQAANAPRYSATL